MADAKLDMSLDALIAKAGDKSRARPSKGVKLSKPKLGIAKGRSAGVAKPTARPIQRAPAAGGRAGGAAAPRRGIAAGALITVRNPAAGRGGAPAPRRAPAPGGRAGAPPPSGRMALAPPPAGRWRHDLYNPNQPAAESARAVGGGGYGGGGGGGAAASSSSVIKNKIFISNLEEKVSDDDLNELFGAMGAMREYGVHYDRTGRSKGTAHVVYVSAESAMRAYKQYHNVALDGHRLNLELVETPVPPGTVKMLSSGINVQRVGGGPPASSRVAPGRLRSVVRGRGAPADDTMQE